MENSEIAVHHIENVEQNDFNVHVHSGNLQQQLALISIDTLFEVTHRNAINQDSIHS